MASYPEDPHESSAPPPEPPPQRPRPSRPPPPRPQPSRPPPPPNPTPNPRLFKLRYFFNDTCFCIRPFQKSSRSQIPPEAPKIVYENPWTSARSDWQKKSEIGPQSCNSEEEEDI
ncbi:hypothetical protein LR48_Vigan06g000400 [Vigna angularis]|uniref:Uncharacterized protein n=2 Tax=Phaseolus angularis TaxID=3914 RepID=A0A0L9UQ89_PHAAN|nr:uncharacterized protein LOC108335581 [Vigna angularis]KOM44699.1 hypothetical protein LR48_Vigan06g000400 [Vigna angularis]